MQHASSKRPPQNEDHSADAPRRGSVRDRITPRRGEGLRAEESGGHGPSQRHSTGLSWSNLSQPEHLSRGGGGLSFQDRASRGPAHVARTPSASTCRRRKSTKDVATLLGISVKTAESHRSRLMQKLDIHETASLVRYAIRHGLVQP